jgi:hypothetical protein
MENKFVDSISLDKVALDRVPLDKIGDKYGKTWTSENIDTLIQWNLIAAYNIAALEMSIMHYQKIMRWNVILGLILSTSSGALSAARFGLDSYKKLGIIFNAIFTFMAFSITVFTGGIKVYQIQENLEIFIRIKQEWINFATLLVSEFQLPIVERVEALNLIKNNKSKYLDLMKTNVEIPEWIKTHVEDHIQQIKMKEYNSKNKKNSGTGHDLVDIIFQVNNALSNQIKCQEMFNRLDEDDVPGIKSDNISNV